MAKTLGGITWAHNPIEQDYCLAETVACLKSLCDSVIILDAGSTDGGYELAKSLEDEKTHVISCSEAEWHKHQGREKISFFQNLAASFLTTDYYICLQADEIIHQDSFGWIRKAIETGRNGFFATRINLWGDSQHYLNVEQERQPVGIYIIRIARPVFKSVDDGESILVQDPDGNYADRIRIYHMGFVRDQRKHIGKIKHIQQEVFQIELDKRIEPMGDKFDPFVMFNQSDLSPIKEELPIFIQQWAKDRDEKNK
jgi:hypothetical protein